MYRMKIVIVDDRHGTYDEEMTILKPLNAEVMVQYYSSEEEAVRDLRDADGILVNLFPITASLIVRLERCRVISRYGAGYDNVDIDAATEKGIQVTYVPDYAEEDVSDHALALMMDCLRSVTAKDRLIRKGEWNLHGRFPTKRLADSVLGIVGFGRTGSALCRKVAGFGLSEILVADPTEKPERIRAAGGEKTDLQTLVSRSDFISLHLPAKEDTRHLFGGEIFSRMKEGAFLINTSRGSIVDETALAEALVTGRLGGAALDVYESEPLPAESPLRHLDNVILSDHTAYYSVQSIRELKTKAAQGVADVLTKTAPVYPVNRVQ